MITRGRWYLVVVAMACAVCAPTSALAHVRSSEGTSVIRQDGEHVRFVTTLEYDVLAAAAGLGAPASGDTDAGRAQRIVDRREELARYLSGRVTVSLDGVQCEGEFENAGLVHRQGTPYIESALVYQCPGKPDGSYRVRYGVFSTEDAVVDNHTNVVDYQIGGTSGVFVFDQGHRELEAGRTAVLTALGRFVVMGVEHILGGLDHVLFLAVLLIGARGLGSVVKVATSFTVAHSLTLALGAVGWVEVPGQVVEPLIALSIAYVAAENILGGESRHRLGIVFGFGLLHGLGFASTLNFTDGLTPRLIGSLASFNLGIELGQVLLICVLFPLLLFIRRFAWSSVAHTVATTAAAMLAMTWFFQRLLT
ncbi:HupE/UreJ family protein [Actinopolymorpha sp. B11F2]|uniref:HupE/UreJ family protein n=1 Tax=Actinopolymorpha sp. B11F2 TaxID=3160862 RepID=UPI0032E4AEC2